MRITQKILYDQARSSIQKNQRKLVETQEQLSTGLRINRPSDDPTGAARAARLQQTLARITQFQRNADQAQTCLDATETALTSVESDVTSVQNLVIEQLSGTQSETSTQAAISELKQLRSSILSSMNAKQDGKYLFSGFQPRTAAFDDGGAFQGTSGQSLEIEIADGDYLAMNTMGDAAFVDSASGQSPVQMIDDAIANLENGDTTSLRNQLPEIGDMLSQVTNAITDVGARGNRLSAAQDDNLTLQTTTQSVLANVQDADTATTATQYSAASTALQAALESSAKMIQTNILDFLR